MKARAEPSTVAGRSSAAHQARDAGEPKMIAALIGKVLKSYDADPSRA